MANRGLQPSAAGDLDTTFNPGIGVTSGGSVLATAVQPDGKILLGGSFASYDGTSCNGLVRVSSNGAIDASFHSGAGPRTAIYSIGLQNDGKILISGQLQFYDGANRNGVARLNSDGTLDSTFNPGVGITNLVSLSVFAIAIQPDQKIVLGGIFSSYDGTPRKNIARINSDGTLDTSFDPGTGASTRVLAIAIQTDGKIIAGGTLTSFNSVNRNYLVRLNANGGVDSTFTPAIEKVSGSGAVYTLIIQPDGKIVVGGSFNLNGAARMVARLNGDGSADSSFASVSGYIAHALALQSDGKIAVAGFFNNYNGTARAGLARANADGSLDTTFDPGSGISGGAVDPLRPGSWIHLQPDGKFLLGGVFTRYGGVLRGGIARVTNNGALDGSFDPGNGAAANGFVYRIALQTDSKILIGGRFTGYNNVRRNGIARIGADGTLDPSFNPGAGIEENSTVTSLVVQTDGKVLVGGSFLTFNGTNRNGFARLNSDGSLDTSFIPAANNIVTAIALQNDGRIVVGGYFTTVQGVSRNQIARLNADGTLDTSFDPGPGINGTINTVAIQKDGKILFGGNFPTADGSSQVSLVRINPDGSVDGSFKPAAMGSLNTIVLQDDGRILIGGSQAIFYNDGKSRFGVARLNSDGSLDTLFDPGVTLDPLNDEDLDVFALATQTDGRIIVGGILLRYDSVPANGLVRAKLDGRLDSSFVVGSGASPIYATAIQADGKILIGGYFIDYNGTARSGIARILQGPPSTIPTIQFGAQNYSVNEGGLEVAVSVTRTGDLSVASTVDYATNDTASTSCITTNGKASSRCDYLKSLGTLSFGINESSKSIRIPVIDDSYTEGSESFGISLANPANANLSSPNSAVVVIDDNDLSNGTNPIDTANFFVRQHYVDFLNRQPDQSGGDFWTNQITTCGSDVGCTEVRRVNVSASFFLSIEFQQTGYLVERLYKTAYGDGDGTSTFNGAHQLKVPIIRFSEFQMDTARIGQGVIVNQGNWQQQLEDNKQAAIADFVQRARFLTSFPVTMQTEQFVDTLNGNAGNPLSQSERDQLKNDLLFGMKTRAQVLRTIAEHPNLVNAEFNRAFVLMQYFGYLRRDPNDPQDTDYTGYDFWLTKLNQFNGNYINAEMVKAFISSIEYRQRFGP